MRHLLIATLVLMTFPAFAGEPAEFVRSYYTGGRTFFDKDAMSHFASPLAEFMIKDAELSAKGDGPGCLDGDPALDAQEFDAKEIAATLKLDEKITGDTATVVADFKVIGDPRRIEWDLVRQDGAWKISDLVSLIGGWRLSELQCGGE